jgi:hypothetical protein
MDVRYLMLARHAELAPDGAANLIGAGSYLRYDMATPTVLPMLYIATQLTMTVEEAAAPHAIEFRVLGPRGEPIAESDPINLPSQSPTSEDAENLGAVVFLGMQNISLSSAGRYRFWLHVDGSPVKEALLRIDSPARTELATDPHVGAKRE